MTPVVATFQKKLYVKMKEFGPWGCTTLDPPPPLGSANEMGFISAFFYPIIHRIVETVQGGKGTETKDGRGA